MIVPQGSDLHLKPGELLRRQISRNETQSFGIELSAGQYAEVIFEWQGINLSVALFDPSTKKLLPADIPVSQPGPAVISVLANESGTYKLGVSTTFRQKITGTYQIKLDEPHVPTSVDRNRFAAQQLLAQAFVSDSNNTKLEKFNQAIQLLQNAQDPTEAQARLFLGDAYRANRDLPKAKANYEQAIAIWHATNYPRGVGYANARLGALSQARGSLKEALEYYSQAQIIFAGIGDKPGEGSAIYGQAFAQLSGGQTVRALELLESVLQIRRSEGDRIGQANALNMMADACRILGNFERSLDLYRQAAEALEGLEHRSLEANILNGTVLVYDDWGDWQLAKDGYARAVSIYEAMLGEQGLSACSSSPPAAITNICRSAASVIDNLGETFNSLGDSQRALQEFSRSLPIREALGEPQGYGSTKFHIAYAHFLLGDLDLALKNYQAARSLQEKVPDDQKAIALTDTYMGMVYTARNEPEEALKLYKKALPGLAASGDKRARTITLDKLATAYSVIGNSKEAANYYNQALELWRAIRDPDGESLTLYNMAKNERSEGNLSAASEHAEAAIKLIDSLRQRVSNAKLRASYLAKNENYYLLNIDLKMQLFKSHAQDYYLAAALESSERSRARVLLDTLNEARLGRTGTVDSPDRVLSGLLERRASLLEKMATKARARTKLLSGEHSSTQIAVIDKEIVDSTDQLDALDAQIKTRSPRFATLTKPQPSSLIQIQQQLDEHTLLLEYALGDKRSYVWVVTPNSIDGFELAPRDQIEAVARRVTEALTARNREVKDESFPQKVLRWERSDKDYAEASAQLSKMVLDQVAPLLLGRKRLVIVADGALQLVPFGALPIPSGALPALANSATDENSKAIANPSAAGNTRPGAGSSSIAGSGSTLLMSAHQIVYLPSASVLALQRRELANRKLAPHAVAVLADPVFEIGDSRVTKATARGNQLRNDKPTISGKDKANTAKNTVLPKESAQSSTASPSPASPGSGTSAPPKGQSVLASALRDVGLDPDRPMRRLAHSLGEAKAIFRVAGPTQSFKALDFKASRATATSSELSKYRIIHFATHGILDLEHPELSGIVLSMVDEKGQAQDGYLRLHEIYNLNLPVELVVLSACQTGVGKQIKGEGLIALTRGFMYAGAKSVVASYWKVDDAATAELMAEFYKQMFTNKLKPAAALQQAQLKMSQQKRWQSPYYWAGFFIQGEWN